MTAFRNLCSPRNAAEDAASIGQFFELYKTLGNPYIFYLFFEPKMFDCDVIF